MRTRRLDDPRPVDRVQEVLRTGLAVYRRLRWMVRPGWSGFTEPFNGQTARRAVVDAISRDYAPDAYVGTGTFLGYTTRYLARYGRPVYSVEADPGYFQLARALLWSYPEVTLIHGDSVRALELLGDSMKFVRPFVYLDAHWGPELPLPTEISTLLANWKELMVLVDDFYVPHEPGYEYAVYEGVPLSLELLSLPEGTGVAFPNVSAPEETGSRRGGVFLAQGSEANDALNALVAQGDLVEPR